MESLAQFAPQSYKERAFISEIRETVDPGLTTQILMPLLEANGKQIFPTILKKHVRDDVCWSDGAVKPWRRCTHWLVLRVAVQRHLSTLLGGELGRLQYKFLICLMMEQFLVDAMIQQTNLDLESFIFFKTKLCSRLNKLEVEKDKVRSVSYFA